MSRSSIETTSATPWAGYPALSPTLKRCSRTCIRDSLSNVRRRAGPEGNEALRQQNFARPRTPPRIRAPRPHPLSCADHLGAESGEQPVELKRVTPPERRGAYSTIREPAKAE